MPIVIATGAGRTVADRPDGGGCGPLASSIPRWRLRALGRSGELISQVGTQVDRFTFGDAGLNPLEAALLPTEGEGDTAWTGAWCKDGLAEMFRTQAESTAGV